MTRRPALPLSLYVVGARCVVIGQGKHAEERAQRLREAGAAVEIVAPDAYQPAVCAGARVVMCCDAARAAQVTADARAAGALAYALDDPDRSDFAMPALARRGPLSVAISSDNVAPALAARLRAELQRLLDEAGPAVDALVTELAQLRAQLPPGDTRRAAAAKVAERLRLDGGVRVDEP
jgi:siroheme synthase (precorrin-2 oxidase/ferrochelatase)